MSDMTAPPDVQAPRPANGRDACETMATPPATEPPPRAEALPASTDSAAAGVSGPAEPRPVARHTVVPRACLHGRGTYCYRDHTGNQRRDQRGQQAPSTLFVLLLVSAVVAAMVVILPFLSP